MITVDTLTESQIRTLATAEQSQEVRSTALQALNQWWRPMLPDEQRDARKRCVDLINLLSKRAVR